MPCRSIPCFTGKYFFFFCSGDRYSMSLSVLGACFAGRTGVGVCIAIGSVIVQQLGLACCLRKCRAPRAVCYHTAGSAEGTL